MAADPEASGPYPSNAEVEAWADESYGPTMHAVWTILVRKGVDWARRWRSEHPEPSAGNPDDLRAAAALLRGVVVGTPRHVTAALAERLEAAAREPAPLSPRAQQWADAIVACNGGLHITNAEEADRVGRRPLRWSVSAFTLAEAVRDPEIIAAINEAARRLAEVPRV